MICLAVFVLSLSPWLHAAGEPDRLAQLLTHADEVKTSNHQEFVDALGVLDAARASLRPAQQSYLAYLHAYQSAYSGDYAAAIPALQSLADKPGDDTLRFRSGVTLTNILALSGRYEEAYRRLNEVLELQSRVPDPSDRVLAYGIAALLYNQAGQYDLAIHRADDWLREDPDGAGACKGAYLKIESLYKTAALRRDSAELRDGSAACRRIGDPVYANIIRTFEANLAIDQDRQSDAIKLLQDNYDAVQGTQYTPLMSEVDSILARAWLGLGELAKARRYADSAVQKSVRGEVTKPLVEAYRTLYETARRANDLPAALTFHEALSNAEKGYLNDASAHALAYQMVNQQVLDRKREIDALSEKNQLLKLQQQVAEKTQETQHLHILLLLLVIAFITLWTYRIKLSQMRFRRLARRDSLTGIVNRQHFMDEAKAILQLCSRSNREACLVLVDLDNFKNVNDTHGHIAGDGVLKQTVEMCQLHMRADDLFGRLGGEEFGVLLRDCTLDTGGARAEELRAAIASFGHAGVEITVSASFGVATSRSAGHDLRQLLIQADSALYRAKRSGRNRVVTYAASVDVGRIAGIGHVAPTHVD